MSLTPSSSAQGSAARGPWLWTRGGHISNKPRNSWIKGWRPVPRLPYGDSGAHGGAARSVTGSDTGGNTRLGTRPTTRPVTVTSQARESARDRARDSPPDHSPERTREFLRRRCFVAATSDMGDERMGRLAPLGTEVRREPHSAMCAAQPAGGASPSGSHRSSMARPMSHGSC